MLKKIVIDTVDVCGRSGDGISDLHLTQVLQIADALCVRLSSADLLRDKGGENAGGGEGQSGDKLLLPSARQTSSINPLLISC